VGTDRTDFVTRGAAEASCNGTDASLGQYQRFMFNEIMEQPETIRKATEQDPNLFNQFSLDILRAEQLIITACGSSRYAALVGRYLFSKIGGELCDVIMAPEFHYFSDSMDRNTLVIAVSESGETADVVEGVRRAKEKKAKVLSIVNRDGTNLSRLSDGVIQINAGPEFGVASTKSFSNQLAIFYLLAFAMVNRFDVGVQKLQQLSQDVARVISFNDKNLQVLAEKLSDQHDFYYIARGINYAIALEGALKVKQVAHVHAEGLPAGELKHGTLALIEQKTPVVAISPRDYTYHEMLTNAMEAKARGAHIIGVCDEANEVFDFTIQIPKVEDLFYPLVAIAPLQLLAYYLAKSRGKDPDRPRNPAKERL